MSFTNICRFPSVEEILSSLPLPKHLAAIKKSRDQEIRRIFTREDQRFLLIIGPCSAHNEDAVCTYVSRLARLQEQVADVLMLIPRIYTNKPRTTGEGYKGMLHQPDHLKKTDIAKGLKAIRQMHLRALEESHLSAADEMLYPGNYPYLADLLSYVAVGARSVENQQHRLTVSGLDVPVGMKNPTSGDLKVMLDSVFAAQISHRFIYNDWEVSTSGNSLTHAVIRGSVDRAGNHLPNYHYEDLIRLAAIYEERKLENPTIIVDLNHSNSGKKYKEQPRIAAEVMHSRRQAKHLAGMIRGLMIESYLLPGSQGASGTEFGRSITDSCLGWDESETLVLKLAESIG